MTGVAVRLACSAVTLAVMAAFAELRTLPGLFESAHLDSSWTSVVWNDRIDLPSDTIREFGFQQKEKARQ